MNRRWTWGAYLVGALVVLVSVLAFTYIYVSAEHTLYTWDFHEYSTRVETTYSTLTRSPLRALVEVYLSTSQEYNLLPTIPLLPLRKLLGPGRLAYELNIAAVLIVPFVMAVGWIGSLTIPGRRGPVFWTTVLIALATPFTWLAILRGFVDLGAATFIVLAIGLYISDPRLTRLWRPIAIGVLLAAAFLFRRPFGYDAVAFGGAVGVLIITRAVIVARTGLQPAIRGLVGDVIRSALVAVGGLVTLVAIGHRLLGRLLLQDTGALYASYDLPAGSVIAWFVSGFGWVVVVLAIAGFVALLRSRLDERVLFIAIYGLVALLLWSLAVGQEGPHYAVHFVLPVVIGLTALAWTIWRAGPARLARPAIAAFALVLLLNFTAGLSDIVPGQGSVVRALVADPNPPMVRADYDEMIRLVGDLRRVAGTDKAILVLGSTDGFSNDTVQIADDVSRSHDATPLFVLNNPHVEFPRHVPARGPPRGRLCRRARSVSAGSSSGKRGRWPRRSRPVHEPVVGSRCIPAASGQLRPPGRNACPVLRANQGYDAAGSDRRARQDARVHPDGPRQPGAVGQRRRVGDQDHGPVGRAAADHPGRTQ